MNSPPSFGTYFSGGTGCSLGARDFDPWPYCFVFVWGVLAGGGVEKRLGTLSIFYMD